MNSLSTQLAGIDKKGVPVAAGESADDMMIPLTGESDPVLMADFFPTALKLYEILSAKNPAHQGLAAMTASLYVMYANVFVQQPADQLPLEQFELQQQEIVRAKMHYLRGRDYALQAFELRYHGFSADIQSGDSGRIEKALANLKLSDVSNAYWCGAGWLGAFSVDPLDVKILSTVSGAVALLEKAAALQSDFNNGAIWEILCAFYAAAPADFGGNSERARYAYEQCLEISGGKTPGPYITYAQSFCIPAQDAAGFDAALDSALAIDPNADPANRLAVILAQKKAQYLKAHRDDFFLVWD
ncbi:MAG: TRAP transporter TatT component family protein [Prevotella sp.]|nr:TRAP transporter TatT component family protein [Prevotella sp.]